jgi:hypothetical protein
MSAGGLRVVAAGVTDQVVGSPVGGATVVACREGAVRGDGTGKVEVVFSTGGAEAGKGAAAAGDEDETGKNTYICSSLAAATTVPSALMAMLRIYSRAAEDSASSPRESRTRIFPSAVPATVVAPVSDTAQQVMPALWRLSGLEE